MVRRGADAQPRKGRIPADEVLESRGPTWRRKDLYPVCGGCSDALVSGGFDVEEEAKSYRTGEECQRRAPRRKGR